jgi:hypothetical protein
LFGVHYFCNSTYRAYEEVVGMAFPTTLQERFAPLTPPSRMLGDGVRQARFGSVLFASCVGPQAHDRRRGVGARVAGVIPSAAALRLKDL